MKVVYGFFVIPKSLRNSGSFATDHGDETMEEALEIGGVIGRAVEADTLVVVVVQVGGCEGE